MFTGVSVLPAAVVKARAHVNKGWWGGMRGVGDVVGAGPAVVGGSLAACDAAVD